MYQLAILDRYAVYPLIYPRVTECWSDGVLLKFTSDGRQLKRVIGASRFQFVEVPDDESSDTKHH